MYHYFQIDFLILMILLVKYLFWFLKLAGFSYINVMNCLRCWTQEPIRSIYFRSLSFIWKQTFLLFFLHTCCYNKKISKPYWLRKHIQSDRELFIAGSSFTYSIRLWGGGGSIRFYSINRFMKENEGEIFQRNKTSAKRGTVNAFKMK